MALNGTVNGYRPESLLKNWTTVSSNNSSSQIDKFRLPLSFMASGVIIGNALVCALFCRFRKLRTITNTFVVSLAVSDGLVALVFVPCFLIMYEVPYMGKIIPYIIGYILFAYLFNFCGITYDRYQAIVHPLTYRAKMTRSVVNRILSLVWSIPMLIALIPILWETQPTHVKIIANQINQGLLIFTVTVISVLICIAYTKLFRETRRQVKSMVGMIIKSPKLERVLSTGSTGRGRNFSRKLSLNIAVEVKAAKVFAVLIGTFSVCWLPLIIINIIEAVGYGNKVPAKLKDVSLFTLVGNSLVDPLIYSFYKADFRKAMRRLFCSTRSRWESDFLSNGNSHFSSNKTTTKDSVHVKKRSCPPLSKEIENDLSIVEPSFV